MPTSSSLKQNPNLYLPHLRSGKGERHDHPDIKNADLNCIRQDYLSTDGSNVLHFSRGRFPVESTVSSFFSMSCSINMYLLCGS